MSNQHYSGRNYSRQHVQARRDPRFDTPKQKRVKDPLSIGLQVVAVIFRVIAIVYSLLTILSFFGFIISSFKLSTFIFPFTAFLPDFLAGRWVLPSPLDGLFRTDFAIFSAVLFALDALLIKIKENRG